MKRVLVIAALALLASCTRTEAKSPIGWDDDHDETPPPAHQKKASVPEDVVSRAEGPVRILRLPDKVELSEREFIDEVLAADAVCAGEEHTDAAHHYGQVWLFDRSAQQAKNRGLELGIGFEMFQQPYQSVLAAYQRGHISEDDLLRRTEYQQRWGYPFAYYRPLLDRARRERLPIIALNARYELTRSVAKEGLDSLGSQKRYELPKLNLDDREHRADFERRMKHHPGISAESLDRYYQAQVIWDEAMAERAASWLAAHAPIRRLIVIAGQAHCQRSAIPARTERRGTFRVKSVLLATPKTELGAAGRFDYALVVGKP